MTQYNFDEIIERKGTDCVKVDKLKDYFGNENLTPLWVADMDFATPDFIADAIKKRCEHPIFGYTYPSDDFYRSIIEWLDKLHGWKVKSEWISFIPGVVKGIAYIVEYFSQKGDKIIIQPPVYHPFRIVPTKLNREVVNNPLKLVNGVYEMDFEQLESIIDDKCKILILSNPHNPAGIVWSEDTLKKLASICSKNNILVISDEIHSEMVYPSHTHIPFAAVSEEASDCSITLSAPSKTFNIAGIVSSYIIIPNNKLRNNFYSYLSAGEYNQGTLFSYLVTPAAYLNGFEWRNQMIDYIMGNVKFVDEYLKRNIPRIKAYIPHASFLVWLDCKELSLKQHELVALFKNKAGLALNDGTTFGKEGEGFMRMNIGCSRLITEKALQQLKKAVES
jgi:cystathionine beta-lyase